MIVFQPGSTPPPAFQQVIGLYYVEGALDEACRLFWTEEGWTQLEAGEDPEDLDLEECPTVAPPDLWCPVPECP